jgi:hypothetical protein
MMCPNEFHELQIPTETEPFSGCLCHQKGIGFDHHGLQKTYPHWPLLTL